MVVPALIYLAVNAGDPATARGWGVPMATDIAFSIGVLALLGRRVPASLKVFLLTLAIVDDIGAIVVIAVVYSSGVGVGWLAVALGAVVVVVVLKRLGVRWLAPYVAVAAVLWIALFESGVHATIAGVVLGLLTPAHPLHRPAAVRESIGRELGDEGPDVDDERDETSFLHIARVSTEGVSPLARLEERLHPWASFVVLPCFALANAGVSFAATGGLEVSERPDPGHRRRTGRRQARRRAGGGVAGDAGVRRPAARRAPVGQRWRGWAMLAGIGFTVSLFVTGLAFEPALADRAKVAVLAASFLAGCSGAAALVLAGRRRRRASVAA